MSTKWKTASLSWQKAMETEGRRAFPDLPQSQCDVFLHFLRRETMICDAVPLGRRSIMKGRRSRGHDKKTCWTQL